VGGTKGGDQGGGPDLPNTGVTATSATTFDRTQNVQLLTNVDWVWSKPVGLISSCFRILWLQWVWSKELFEVEYVES